MLSALRVYSAILLLSGPLYCLRKGVRTQIVTSHPLCVMPESVKDEISPKLAGRSQAVISQNGEGKTAQFTVRVESVVCLRSGRQKDGARKFARGIHSVGCQ